ncbi:methyltransferase domain-containing protein [Sarocladium implicatum]|nr:methyltransferase domain-containing protein [Sarocladium implicatum]
MTRISEKDMAASFTRVADIYFDSMPHWHTYAQHSIDAAPPFTADSIVHDNAAGPGIVTNRIIINARKSGAPLPKLVTTDVNEAMIEVARKQCPEADVKVMDSRKLEFAEGTFTHSFTNFLLISLFPIEENIAFARNVRRTIAPGGTAVFAIWYRLEWMQILRDAANAVKPDGAASIPDDSMSQETVRQILTEAGFPADGITITSREGVQNPIVGKMREMMEDTAGNIGKMATMGWSEEEKTEWPVKVKMRFDRAAKEETRYPMAAWIVSAKC